jgi:hypothetical protein
MPFDTTKLRHPTVTILPPTPPERGEGPRRVHLVVEIIDRRQQSPRRGYRFGTLAFWLLVLALAALAHVDGQGIRYEHWQDTNGWHGETGTPGHRDGLGRLRAERPAEARPPLLRRRHGLHDLPMMVGNGFPADQIRLPMGFADASHRY